MVADASNLQWRGIVSNISGSLAYVDPQHSLQRINTTALVVSFYTVLRTLILILLYPGIV
jgi:hypothetical protein